MSNQKMLDILIDLLWDLPVCGCRESAMVEIEKIDLNKKDFLKVLKEVYLENTCKTCSPDVLEEFDFILESS